jgi:hypothetical protein
MEVSRHWRLKAQSYRMEGSICPICGQVNFPPRSVCPHSSVQPARVAGFGQSALPASYPSVEPVSLERTTG